MPCRVCYERVPFQPMAMSFLLSAYWHGFYPSYYVCFIMLAVLVQAARKVLALTHTPHTHTHTHTHTDTQTWTHMHMHKANTHTHTQDSTVIITDCQLHSAILLREGEFFVHTFLETVPSNFSTTSSPQWQPTSTSRLWRAPSSTWTGQMWSCATFGFTLSTTSSWWWCYCCPSRQCDPRRRRRARRKRKMKAELLEVVLKETVALWGSMSRLVEVAGSLGKRTGSLRRNMSRLVEVAGSLGKRTGSS